MYRSFNYFNYYHYKKKCGLGALISRNTTEEIMCNRGLLYYYFIMEINKSIN